MRSWIKYLLIVLVILFIASAGLRYWLEHKITAELSASSDRKYLINFDELDLHPFYTGFSVKNLNIKPAVNDKDTLLTSVTGYVESAEVSGFKWINLLLSNSLHFNSMTFVHPEFKLLLRKDSARMRRTSGKSLQEFFGDILSRAEVKNFEIAEGSLLIERINVPDTSISARIEQINIIAQNIQTDSVKLGHIIPFELGSISTSFQGITFHPDEFSQIVIGDMNYNSDSARMFISGASHKLSDSWFSTSERLGVQQDIFEWKLGSITIDGLIPQSSLYDSLNIEASFIQIDSFELHDYRNKNIPRPAEPEKPLFSEMIASIPFPISVDSVHISNSSIFYTELGPGQPDAGTLHFANFNANISHITNRPEKFDSVTEVRAALAFGINNSGKVNVNLTVPYSSDGFMLDAVIRDMDIESLNPTVMPLANVKVNSGRIHELHLSMNAGLRSANSQMTFNYEELNVALLVENKDKEMGTAGFLSNIANSAIRKSNMPGDNDYQQADYLSERNMERGPFNYIWQSVKEGLGVIVPSRTASLFIGKKKK